MSKKLISVLVAAGLGLGLNTFIAQNVDSDKDKAQGQEQLMRDKEQSAQKTQTQAGTLRNFNDAGERQVGLEQYLQEQQQCGAVAAENRQDCMQIAKVRYEGWAIMQCQLVRALHSSVAIRMFRRPSWAIATRQDRAREDPARMALRKRVR